MFGGKKVHFFADGGKQSLMRPGFFRLANGMKIIQHMVYQVHFKLKYTKAVRL